MKAIASLAAALFVATVIAPAAAKTVSISTLPPGAINNVQAQVVARVVQDNTDHRMRVVTFNSSAAVIGSTAAGQTEFSFTSNDEAGVAFEGVADYEGRAMPSLRVATTVFTFKVGLVVRRDSDIMSVADLRGRRFPIGWQGFSQGVTLSSALLATAGLTLDDTDGIMTTNLLRAADDFKAGRLDATMFAIGAPKMAELDAAIGIRFLDLPDTAEANTAMAAIRPEYHLAEQDPAPHLAGVIERTTLMEYAIVIMTRDDVDDTLVYDLVKALHDNKAGLVAGHPSFNAMTPEGLASPQARLIYHPGAVRFFEEAGIWTGE